ncbi:MAG: hypothetical protein LBM62_05800 [Mediterranea sp.]|jgi:hypothetical protein|nr:hypothetical protein [Mediterranea sp.]
MNEQEIDELVRQALESERKLPEGLPDRLLLHLQRLAAEQPTEQSGEQKPQTKLSIRRRKMNLRLVGIAASLLICAGLYTALTFYPPTPQRKDTFTNPQEAALVAQNALMLLSTQLNKGLKPVAEAGHDMDKVGATLTNQLKIIIKHSEQ